MGDKEKEIKKKKAKSQNKSAENVKEILDNPEEKEEEKEETKDENKCEQNDNKQEIAKGVESSEASNEVVNEVIEETIKEVKEDKKDNKTEEMKKNEKQPVENVKGEATYVKANRDKKVVPIVITTILICVLLLFSVVFALININNDKIISGISIMGIEVDGLSKEEATKKLQELTESKSSEDISLKYEDFETNINGKQFNISYDVEKAVAQAYNIGRDGNIIVNNYSILSAKLFKKNIDIQINYDAKLFSEKLQDISAKIPGAVKQSNYYVEDEKLIIVKGKAGLKIKEAEIKESIFEQLEKILNKNEIITIPVETVEADAIDLKKIKEEIYKEPQDAYVSKNPTTVHPHVNGVDFKVSIEEAQKLLEENKEEYTIPLKITIPKKTIRNLGEEAFPDLISTYTTRYDASNYNRSNNLSIAVKKVNGTVLMPGETFSYNKVVGERTIAAGYREAGAYAGGKVIQSVGGGICQISSTLYNTALLANLEIVDRSNHQFETGYVAASRDATVAWPSLDFKFKNTRKYPIKIVASAKSGVAKISIYGIKEETEYEVVIQSKVLSYIPNTTKYIEDSSLEEGKEVVEQSGHNGCQSEAYRILKLNGKVVSKTLLSRDTYDAMQTIIRRGTKKKAAPVTPTTPTTPTTTTPTTPSTSDTPTTPTTPTANTIQ